MENFWTKNFKVDGWEDVASIIVCKITKLIPKDSFVWTFLQTCRCSQKLKNLHQLKELIAKEAN